MEKLSLVRRRIEELVDENYVHAYVLHYFGIKFYDYSEHTLEEVCKERGLLLEHVVKEMESPLYLKELDIPLVSFPLDLILAYLKHSHYLYLKYKLPYIVSLVDNFKPFHPEYLSIAKDLKIVFPLFVEDFIQHIHQEEDTLFTYIKILDQALKEPLNPSKLYYHFEKNSIQKFAMEHEVHDDEMKGIRLITHQYRTNPGTPLHVKVIYNELMEFESSLHAHATIENEILFPKALALENQVKTLFFKNGQWN